ncbi:hypothetical protein MTO96_045417 [Rhipicephalus appendiculatus]
MATCPVVTPTVILFGTVARMRSAHVVPIVVGLPPGWWSSRNCTWFVPLPLGPEVECPWIGNALSAGICRGICVGTWSAYWNWTAPLEPGRLLDLEHPLDPELPLRVG